MAWLGQRLVACTSLEYMLLDVAAGSATSLFSLPAEAPPPTRIQQLPGGVPLALLLMASTQLSIWWSCALKVCLNSCQGFIVQHGALERVAIVWKRF